MDRLLDVVSQIKIYNKCYHCDYYNEDNLCMAEVVNCDEVIAKQIRNEILDEVIEEIKSHSEDDKLMNELYVEWISNMKEEGAENEI